MTLLHRGDMTDTLTRWPRSGGTFGAPVLHSPGSGTGVKWMNESRSRFSKEESRRSNQGGANRSVFTVEAFGVGDVVALGDQRGDVEDANTPFDVPGVHEVVAYRETRGFDASFVRRATVVPLLGQLFETVALWPIYREPSGRSYIMRRGIAPAYQGPASVRLLSQSEQLYAGQTASVYDAVVTVPASFSLNGLTRSEVEWINSPVGSSLIDVVGPLWDPEASPFWRSFAGVARRPATDEDPSKEFDQPDGGE